MCSCFLWREREGGKGSATFFFSPSSSDREKPGTIRSLSFFFHFSLSLLELEHPILPDPVRRLQGRLLVEIEHRVRAVVERVPGQRRRGRRGGGIGGAIACCCRSSSALPGSHALLLLLRSRRRAREQHEHCEEQGWTATPHPEEARGMKARASLCLSLFSASLFAKPKRKNETATKFSLSFFAPPPLKSGKNLLASCFFQEKKEPAFFSRRMLRRGLATLGGRVLAAACSETSAAAAALASSSSGSFASSAATTIRGAAVASSSSSSPSFWRGEFSLRFPLFSTQAPGMRISRALCVLGKRGETLFRGRNRPRKRSFFFCFVAPPPPSPSFFPSFAMPSLFFSLLSARTHAPSFFPLPCNLSIPHIRLRIRHLPAARAHHPLGDGRRRRRHAPDDARAQEPDGRHYVRFLFLKSWSPSSSLFIA